MNHDAPTIQQEGRPSTVAEKEAGRTKESGESPRGVAPWKIHYAKAKLKPGFKELRARYKATHMLKLMSDPARYAEHLAKARERERIATAEGRRRKPDKFKEALRQREARQKHRLKHKARSLVSTAIHRGKLIPKPCEKCGAEISEAHHDDYSKPLEVRWLCSTHHTEHHNNERLRNRLAARH